MFQNIIPFLFFILPLLGTVQGQVQTTCNPLTANNCPPDPALSGTFQYDFANGESESFYTDSWWLPFISYDKTDGATFSITRKGVAPTLTSKFYVMFGRFEIAIKTASGTGIISDVILQSDDQDEVDLEWIGSQPTQVQTNYYSIRNRPPVYNQGFTHELGKNLQTDFHTYTVDWNVDRLIFAVDGNTIRTVNSENNDQYPRTPMKVAMGLWAGGDSDNAPGTIQWAGGATDYSQAPFNMSIKSVKVVDYSTGESYSYKDKSGSTDSIEAKGGKINPHATDADSKSDVSQFSDAGTIVTTSAISSSSVVASHTEAASTSDPSSQFTTSDQPISPPASSGAATAEKTTPDASAPEASTSAEQQPITDSPASTSAPPITGDAPSSTGPSAAAAAPKCSDVSTSPAKTGQPTCGQKLTSDKQSYNLQCDTDSYGGDICYTTTPSLGDCVTRCDAENGCIGAVYKPESTLCYLKSANGVVYHQDGTQWASVCDSGQASPTSNQGSTSSTTDQGGAAPTDTEAVQLTIMPA